MNAKAEMFGEILEQIPCQRDISKSVQALVFIYRVQYCKDKNGGDDDLCFHEIERQELDGTWTPINACGGSYLNDDEGIYDVISHGFMKSWTKIP
jgi:hypothetical protein